MSASELSRGSSTRLGWLQILRALAAAGVVVAHIGLDVQVVNERLGTRLEFWNLNWVYGVDIFFLISGFIMLRSSLDDFGKPGAASDFLLRRIVRIAPLYWILTLLLALGGTLSPNLLNGGLAGPDVLATSMLFIPYDRARAGIAPLLGVGWTLNYEMFFYVLFAAAMLLPRKFGLPALFATLIGLSVSGAVFHFEAAALSVWTDPLLLEFLMGMGVALLSRQAPAPPPKLAIALLTAVALALSALVLFRWLPLTPRALFAGIPAMLLVTLGVYFPQPRHSRLFTFGEVLGDASFSLYLSHLFTIRLVRELYVHAIGTALPVAFFALLAFLSAQYAAVLIYRHVERPLTLAITGYTAHSRRRTQSA